MISARAKDKGLEGKEKCLKQKNIRLEFEVKDTGKGIKEEDIPKLFNSFEILQKAVDESPIGDFNEALHNSLHKKRQNRESFEAENARISCLSS